MGVIVSIVVVVGLVLLYDFYSSRKWQLETSEIRNKIVFENRNKEYGAYVLRKSYDKTMIFILLGVMSATGVAYGITNVWLHRDLKVKTKIIETEIDPKIVGVEKEVELVEQTSTKPEPKQEQQESSKFNVPVFTDIPSDSDLKTQDELDNKNISDKDIDGIDDPFLPPIDEKKTVNIVEPNSTLPDDIIDIGLTEEPSFIAGSLQSWISMHVVYPPESISIQEEGKVFTEFVIEKDGSVSMVKVVKSVSTSLDDEAVRVIKAMPKWLPGKQNGKIVRSRVRLPITFSLTR